MLRTAVAVLALLAVGCTGLGPEESEATEPEPTTTSPVPTSTLPPVVECPGTGDFEEGGGIARIDGEGTDSASLGRISWQTSDQCESFVFEFETSEGAPATTLPEIELAHLETFQVLRVRLGVARSVIADQLVETGLVDRLYVVHGVDGATFVDLHLLAPAAARARVESSPARLIIDLRPGFVDFSGRSVTSDQVVVVSPGTGAAVDPVSQFIGYARGVGSSLSLIVTQGDAVITDASTEIPSEDGWVEFRHEIGLPPGNVSVFIGDSEPDGGLEGVTVDLAVG